jgi:hypothetical protein
MILIERFWAVVTSFISILFLSPAAQWSETQTPLQPLPALTPINNEVDYPIFKPPGGDLHSKGFRCEYQLMKGWEDCSHELDRKCCIRRKSDGKQFDLNTDYENFWPTGVERHYTIDLANGSYAADGLHFDQAKLFNQSYPGPWIEACWGDR